MATTNINEAGWFYHAPGKRQQHERADYPPASQIPGLGDYTVESDQPSPPHQMVFKDSDSKYIRLAKMGGRKDLLCMNPRLAEDKAREPVGYPRCDWFYLEDNAVENATLKQEMNWQFLLPDYMVHEEHQMDPAGFSGDKKRPPYGFDKMTAFQRDGEGLTDKTVKLPELQRPGFGVRNSKPIKVIMKQPTHSVKLRAPASQQAPVKPRSSGLAAEERGGQMDKILANKYQEEWAESHKRQHYVPCKSQNVQSEYKEAYGLAAKASAKERKKSANSTKSSAKKQQSQDKMASMKIQKQVEAEKERFILSRFKNVGSKIDSHQKPKPAVEIN